jgi:hypothetical protein
MGRNNKDFDMGRPDSFNQGRVWAPGAKEKVISDNEKQMKDLGYTKNDKIAKDWGYEGGDQNEW